MFKGFPYTINVNAIVRKKTGSTHVNLTFRAETRRNVNCHIARMKISSFKSSGIRDISNQRSNNFVYNRHRHRIIFFRKAGTTCLLLFPKCYLLNTYCFLLNANSKLPYPNCKSCVCLVTIPKMDEKGK